MRNILTLFLSSLLLIFTACSNDSNEISTEIPNKVILQEHYTTVRANVLIIKPEIKGFKNAKYQWTQKATDGSTLVLGNTATLSFITTKVGEYPLQLHVTNSDGKVSHYATSVTVTAESTPYSAYLSKVYDFLPAVGQFVNTLPEYKAGDTQATMNAKAESYIKGKNPSGMVSLGGYGGYIVFGFDHTIANVAGKKDFRILGNTFWSAKTDASSKRGGSCEPAIIMVAYDANKNGKPDDKWYQIAGSEYANKSVITNYEITYYRPEKENEEATEKYIKWENNQGESGYIPKNNYHRQPYFPQWITADKITFKGRRLPNNGVNTGTTEKPYWVLYSFAYGYADNAPNNDEASAIDIAWAVDENGAKANLAGVDFIKVYNAEQQICGWLGETSTEVTGAVDLHLMNTK